MSKWKPAGADPDTLTAVNTEWGGYSSSHLPRRGGILGFEGRGCGVSGGRSAL
jgi:hypothetical protein